MTEAPGTESTVSQAEQGAIARRLAALRERIEATGTQCMLVSNPFNRRYLSGFRGESGWLLIPSDPTQRPALITDFRFVEQAREEAPLVAVVRHFAQFSRTLAEELAARGVTRVAIEADSVTVAQLKEWQEAVPGVEFVPVSRQVEGLRAVKDEGELSRIRRAVELTDRAFEAILPKIRPGVTEKEIAWELEWFLKKGGAEGLSFPPIVAGGPRGALPHAVPTDAPIREGSFLVLDFGCLWEGYCSDMTRTVFVGRPDDRARRIYDLVLQAQGAGIEAIRPGRTGAEVDRAARDRIAAEGFGDNFGHSLGHGVGLEVHDPLPRLSSTSDVVLEPGMVTSVEPGIYIPGWGGVRIEDLVVVTDKGCTVLSQSPKELIAVG